MQNRDYEIWMYEMDVASVTCLILFYVFYIVFKSKQWW